MRHDFVGLTAAFEEEPTVTLRAHALALTPIIMMLHN
jgi:hypothetical protein